MMRVQLFMMIIVELRNGDCKMYFCNNVPNTHYDTRVTGCVQFEQAFYWNPKQIWTCESCHNFGKN